MDCNNIKFFTIIIFLFSLLSLIIISFASSPGSLLFFNDHDQLQTSPPVSRPDDKYTHGFRIRRRTKETFLNIRKNKNHGGTVLRKNKSRKTKNNIDARRFSAMLPKGYVPPSGSSPCHNLYPNSVTFFCAEVRQP
ncbi:hypothetical protein OROGR_000971 [Orobanche gracilis]